MTTKYTDDFVLTDAKSSISLASETMLPVLLQPYRTPVVHAEKIASMIVDMT